MILCQHRASTVLRLTVGSLDGARQCSLLTANSQISVLISQKMQLTDLDCGNDIDQCDMRGTF